MRTNFLKIAALLSLGAISFFTSCNKEELNNEFPAVNEMDAESFQNLLDEIATDTNVVSYSIMDENEGLRSVSSGYATDDRAGIMCLNDLKVISRSGSKPGSTLNYNGTYYKRINVDLNMEAGGDYVYLYYNTTPYRDKAVGYIDGYYNTTSYKSGSTMVYDVTTAKVADMNQGTKKGGKINLGMRKDGKRYIHGLAVVAYKSAKNGYYQGMYRVANDMDMNKGAGGRYIYLFALTSTK